jgi:hypothetical protein
MHDLVRIDIDILKDHEVSVRSEGIIKKGVLVLKNDPLLTYLLGKNGNGLPLQCALNQVPGKILSPFLKYLFQLYPRSEEDMLRGFRRLYYDQILTNDLCEQLLTQIENVIAVYCGCNCFKVDDGENLPYRMLLYIEGSMFNHSCNPNCHWQINNDTLYIYASIDISYNTELTISYLSGIESFDGRFRRNSLMKLNFVCSCTKCIGRCNFCDVYTPATLLKCGKCKAVPYCSKECQKRDWSVHKGLCKLVAI